ncbi:MAG TPA: hypothetical protein DCW90_00320 [Lachnospiraceae bacterium]|nr:hypothetical protein [Lachnospiraceae bacterium]
MILLIFAILCIFSVYNDKNIIDKFTLVIISFIVCFLSASLVAGIGYSVIRDDSVATNIQNENYTMTTYQLSEESIRTNMVSENTTYSSTVPKYTEISYIDNGITKTTIIPNESTVIINSDLNIVEKYEIPTYNMPFMSWIFTRPLANIFISIIDDDVLYKIYTTDDHIDSTIRWFEYTEMVD